MILYFFIIFSHSFHTQSQFNSLVQGGLITFVSILFVGGMLIIGGCLYVIRVLFDLQIDG